MDITKRFDRILQVFFLLQSRSVVTAEELTSRFETSKRTIYRDLNALELAGIPIASDSGKYSIVESYRLQPSRFTQEEILSLMVAEKLMQKHETELVKTNFETALIKVKSSFQVQQKKEFYSFEDKLHFKENFKPNQYLPNILEVLLNSIVKKKITEIAYVKSSDVLPVNRRIEAIGIVYENQFWYLFAYCNLSAGYRNFRLDRIKKITQLDQDFSKIHPSISEFQALNASIHFTKITIRVDQEFAHYLFWDRHNFGFVREEVVGNQVLMHFDCLIHPTSFVRWFTRFADIGEIMEPTVLNTELLDILTAGVRRIEHRKA